MSLYKVGSFETWTYKLGPDMIKSKLDIFRSGLFRYVVSISQVLQVIRLLINCFSQWFGRWGLTTNCARKKDVCFFHKRKKFFTRSNINLPKSLYRKCVFLRKKLDNTLFDVCLTNTTVHECLFMRQFSSFHLINLSVIISNVILIFCCNPNPASQSGHSHIFVDKICVYNINDIVWRIA